MNKIHQGTKEVALVAILSAILLVQQMALSFLPNIQTTFLLLVLYAKVIGFRRTTLIVIIHVIAYNMLSPFGAVIPLHMISMFVGYMLVPVLLHTVFKKAETSMQLALFGILMGFLYGWTFIPISVFVLQTPFRAYLLMDLPFEMIMAASNFLTIYWLYEPLKRVLVEQTELYHFSIKHD